jgi:hypothetical protein
LSGTTFTSPTPCRHGADTTCNITRPKKLIQYAGGALLPRYFTIDEYDIDIDQSEVATDFVWSGFKFSMTADGIIMVSLNGAGTGKFDPLATGLSPLLTAPTEGTGAAAGGRRRNLADQGGRCRRADRLRTDRRHRRHGAQRPSGLARRNIRRTFSPDRCPWVSTFPRCGRI